MPKHSVRKKKPKMENMESTDTDQSNDQSFTERRFLRSGYLSIQNFIHDKRDEIAAASAKKFLSIVNEVDEMHHLVTKPREQVSDAEALRDLANTLVTSIRVHSTGSITPSVFVSSLITEYSQKSRIRITESTQVCWKDIGVLVSPLLMICRGSCTMFGPMGYEIKPPKVLVGRKRPRSSVKEEKVKPEEFDITFYKERKETEKTIATMFDILKHNKNARLENLILNRISFAQTVENLFALSFLVKDGRVVITLDENDSHYVSPRNAPASGAVMSGKVVYCHFVFRFGFNDWKLMKDFVAEGSELMPHRTKLNHSDTNQSEPDLGTNNNQNQNKKYTRKNVKKSKCGSSRC